MSTNPHPDLLVMSDRWSDLSRFESPPMINIKRLHDYRRSRLREALQAEGAAMCILVNPISLRYAIDYRNYGLFQSHIPTTYLFFPLEGPIVLNGGYGEAPWCDEMRTGQPCAYFDGGPVIGDAAVKLADDVVNYLSEIGTDNRRVAVEYINPSVTQALEARGLEVIDGVRISEAARVIKNEDEIACIRWAIAVAEHGITQMHRTLKTGVQEVQLWALLNYTNLANNGDWHEGRMLASGPRINPWLQEASNRVIEAGDLVGFDTDMVGPYGYFADISRTLYCGPGKPSRRQRELYRLTHAEVEHNCTLMRPGITLSEIQQQAFAVPEAYHQNAYTCVIHGVGMCDEYPQVKPRFRMPNHYEGSLEPGMVICVESYMGAVGETNGVKLEEQVLITEQGHERMTRYPFEAALLE